MLTLQFVPYHEIETLTSEQKIRKLLGLVKDDKIVLMQGRLKFVEETRLIETTMKEISPSFKGIEICTIYPRMKSANITDKLRAELISLFLGNRDGLTIIGPATLVKEIKRDPNKVQLFAKELSVGKKRLKVKNNRKLVEY